MSVLRLFKSESENDQYVSALVDPFKKESLESIYLRIDKNWNGVPQFNARICFSNGPTNGEHKITSPDFNSLVKSVELFIKSLES